jgi:hypothetical protein
MCIPFNCEKLVLLVEKLGLRRGVGEEEAIQQSASGRIQYSVLTHKTTNENATVRQPKKRKIIFVIVSFAKLKVFGRYLPGMARDWS